MKSSGGSCGGSVVVGGGGGSGSCIDGRCSGIGSGGPK